MQSGGDAHMLLTAHIDGLLLDEPHPLAFVIYAVAAEGRHGSVQVGPGLVDAGGDKDARSRRTKLQSVEHSAPAIFILELRQGRLVGGCELILARLHPLVMLA